MGKLRETPQTVIDLEFGRKALEDGLRSDSLLWEEITASEAGRKMGQGHMVSSALVLWEGVDEEGIPKGRFVHNFKR